jgi:hypothetical protein
MLWGPEPAGTGEWSGPVSPGRFDISAA